MKPYQIPGPYLELVGIHALFVSLGVSSRQVNNYDSPNTGLVQVVVDDGSFSYAVDVGQADLFGPTPEERAQLWEEVKKAWSEATITDRNRLLRSTFIVRIYNTLASHFTLSRAQHLARQANEVPS